MGTGPELAESDLQAVMAVIEHVTLASIDYYEVSASRLDDGQEVETDGSDNLSISVQYRGDEETSFGLRLLAEVVLPHGRARACVAAEYKFDDGFAADHRSCQVYVNEVGVMTLYPYLREAMATTTGRVFDEPLHLPVIQRGDVALDLPDSGPAQAIDD